MRCRKAKYWIRESGDLSREQLTHLETCQSCRRYYRVVRILDKSLQSLRAEIPADSTPISVLKAEMAARMNRKEYTVMSKLKNAWGAHPRLSLGVTVGVLAMIFFVLVPIPYQRTAGYNVQFGGVSRANQIDMKQVAEALKAVGFEQVGVNVAIDGDRGDISLTNLPSYEDAKRAAAAFASLTGTAVRPVFTPIIETVSGSLYAQVKDKLVKVEINGAGKTDEQVRAEIEAQLAAQGFTGSVISLKSDSAGQRQIQLEIEGGGNNSGQTSTTVQVDTRGKSKEQIEAEVKARLAAQGHPDANINVTESGSDSLRQVEIKIETPPANK